MAALTWGDPTASKQVLLIHGMMGSSHGWYRVAQDFASRDYFVTAPDLLGHGNARRGSVYTIAALVEELRPFLASSGDDDHPYDIVVGYSFGGIVTAALLPFLKSSRPVQVILIDPPFEVTAQSSSFSYHRKMMSESIRYPRPPEAFLQEHPLWTKEDATAASLSAHLCDVDAVEAILDQNIPWSFLHYLSAAPENVKVTVLAADPTKGPSVREGDFKQFPHVTTKTVWGASHFIPLEFPQVVVETALEGNELRN